MMSIYQLFLQITRIKHVTTYIDIFTIVPITLIMRHSNNSNNSNFNKPY